MEIADRAIQGRGRVGQQERRAGEELAQLERVGALIQQGGRARAIPHDLAHGLIPNFPNLGLHPRCVILGARRFAIASGHLLLLIGHLIGELSPEPLGDFILAQIAPEPDPGHLGKVPRPAPGHILPVVIIHRGVFPLNPGVGIGGHNRLALIIDLGRYLDLLHLDLVPDPGAAQARQEAILQHRAQH